MSEDNKKSKGKSAGEVPAQIYAEDMSDEWLYRCATGTRWYFPENTTFASHDLALDSSVGIYANGMGIPTWRMATNIADDR